MTKYSGKTLFLEEQPDGRYTLYNWYHSPIATAELEELVPIIRDWEPPKSQVKEDYGLDLDTLNLILDNL